MHPLSISTMKYKLALYAPAERTDILYFPYFYSTLMYSVVTTKKSVPGSTFPSLFQRKEGNGIL